MLWLCWSRLFGAPHHTELGLPSTPLPSDANIRRPFFRRGILTLRRQNRQSQPACSLSSRCRRFPRGMSDLVPSRIVVPDSVPMQRATPSCRRHARSHPALQDRCRQPLTHGLVLGVHLKVEARYVLPERPQVRARNPIPRTRGRTLACNAHRDCSPNPVSAGCVFPNWLLLLTCDARRSPGTPPAPPCPGGSSAARNGTPCCARWDP